mgnify:FL=1
MDDFDALLADVTRDEWRRQQAGWAAIGKQVSEMRAELGRVLDALNEQDPVTATVRLDEALSYAATLLMWREAIK